MPATPPLPSSTTPGPRHDAEPPAPGPGQRTPGRARSVVPSSETAAAPRRGGAALVASLLGFTVITIDVSAVNIALPSIRSSLDSGMSGLQWVVDAYTLMFAALMLSAGDHTRRLLTLAILTAVGNEHELDMHIRAALRAGIDPDELVEVFLHTAVYAGVPNSNLAFALGKQALADLSAEPEENETT
ncbi:carboxymuconolactone decarboxylase family protein [Streptomyces sp. NPDC002130]|uniref:carboxymuconolactone decarboxylase family protein n=1 Tax=Streptomyces sp. NPDC002130 TaxID=3155568 RepID=UPI0033305250